MGKDTSRLKRSVAITGATSGIGEALAIECAKRGETLFLSGRSQDRLESIVHRCKELGAAHVEGTILDVRHAGSVAKWLEQSDATSPLNRIFANAGVATGEESSANVRTTFETNIGGVVNTVLPAIEIFRRHKAQDPAFHAQILMTSSIAGYGPLPSCPSYSATKAAVKTWALSLRGMLAKEGIEVSAICPGFVRSRITDRNTCPMPFFLEADKAARIILSRADADVGLIAFPWPMRFASWAFSILPERVNGFFARLLPPKTSKDR